MTLCEACIIRTIGCTEPSAGSRQKTEEKVGVNYRYIKKFEGHYVDENKKKLIKSCEMYVRKTDLVSKTIINKKFDKILKKKNALKETSFKKIKFSIVDINTAYFLMKNDIKNQSGLIQGKRL